MDVIEKQILVGALKQYKEYLFIQLDGYSVDEEKKYAHETRAYMAKCDNLIKRTWEGCL
jgi:hypothetical protein